MTLSARMPIVVGVDFSSCSKSALVQAVQLANATRATLHVFHAVEPLVVTNLADTLPESVEELRQRVVKDSKKALVEAMGQVGDMRPEQVEMEVTVGSPVQEVLRKAQAVSADLLVLGMFGAFGAGRMVGATVGKCIKKATTSILVVRESHAVPFRAVVVCVDFSDSSRAALEYGVRIAALYRSQLYLLHVFRGPWHRLHYRAPTREANPDFEKQYLTALQARLEALLEPFTDELKGLSPQCELYDSQDCYRGIVDFSLKTGADLVVVGSRKTNLYSLIFGSIAERVVQDIPCSILVARAMKESD
jgi:nucleotide-binding universal stress UspA family protein